MADIVTIDDKTDIPEPPPGQGMGLIPRDWMTCPVGYLPVARPFDLPLADDQTIEAAIKRQADEKSTVKDVFFRNGMKPLDQNGQGYCWAYSTTSGVMVSRVVSGLPYVRLSAHMVACIIKGYRDQGGWNAQSVDFVAANGVPSVEFWPEKSMSRSNDTPAMRENAKQHQLIEFMDLDDSGPNLKRQLATCFINNIVVATDYNWWSHSVMAGVLRKWGPNGASFEDEILNSWGEWSDRGWGVLAGSRAIPNGAIAIRVSKPSMT